MPDEAKNQVEYLDVDVLTMAKRRIRHVYASFDQIWVAYSGGKDSLATLHLVEEVARELGETGKINVLFRDEELIPDEVIEFIQDYAADPKYNFLYIAVPMMSTKFILGRTVDYIQWDPARRWIRPKPANAITDLGKSGSHVYSQYDMDQAIFEPMRGKIAVINGIRADESLIRYRSCVNKRNENYINATDTPKVKFVKPIYDWTVQDVFKYLMERQIKYCGIYDQQLWNGMKLRVATPLHAEAAKSFAKWRTLYPVFYSQLIDLFPEMLAQERYWADLDRYGIIYRYERSWSGIMQYIRENIEDPAQRALARQRVQSARERRERHERNGTAEEYNLWGYPILYVFKLVVAGNYKRVINPCRYLEMKTVIDSEALLYDTLCTMGFSPKIHHTAVQLEGYHGDLRAEVANVIIPRAQLGSASNDIGFVKTANGSYSAIISEYDRMTGYGEPWMGTLLQGYSEQQTIVDAREHGYVFQGREVLKDGTIQLTFGDL